MNVVHRGCTFGGLGIISLARGDTFISAHISSLLASALKQLSIEHNLKPQYCLPLTKMSGWVIAAIDALNYAGAVSFTPENDIPDLAEKVILVTGGGLNRILTGH